MDYTSKLESSVTITNIDITDITLFMISLIIQCTPLEYHFISDATVQKLQICRNAEQKRVSL